MYTWYVGLKVISWQYSDDSLYLVRKCVNPCPAELFQMYFSSFEAGIADAISSSKWRKIVIFLGELYFFQIK